MKINHNYKKSLPDGWEITIADSLEGIEAIRPVWQEMQSRENCPTVDADIDRFLPVIESMKGKAPPYIIVLSYNHKPVVMIVGRIEMQKINIKLGYKTILSPRLKCLTVSYGGVIGEVNSDTCSFLVCELMNQLRCRKFSMVYFNRLKANSNLFNLCQKLPGFLCRDYIPIIDLHWQTTALSSKDEFYKTLSRNERRNISRHTKQLENKASGIIELKSYRGLNDLDEYISIASRISAVTYQKILTGGFSDNYSTRYLLTEAAKKDWFRAYVLYAGSEPIAFESGLLYNATYFAEYRGFNPDWTCGSPGSILLLKILEKFSQDPNIQKYDYGFGDAPYKQRYGQEKWTEAPIYIFAPRLYPMLVNLIRILFLALEMFLKFILRKYGFIDRVKRNWRKRLEQRALRKEKNSCVSADMENPET